MIGGILMAFISHTKHLKNAILIILSLIILTLAVLFLTARSRRPIYKTPYEYSNSTWESEDPYIYFHVEDKWNPNNAEIYTLIDGEKKTLQFLCSDDTRIAEFVEKTWENGIQTERYLTVDCRFYKDKVTMSIIKDDIFDGQYKRIVLYKTGSNDDTLPNN